MDHQSRCYKVEPGKVHYETLNGEYKTEDYDFGMLIPAYTGLFFLLSGGVISHLASGEELMKAFPVFVFLWLNVASWYLRPMNRKIQISNNENRA